MKTSTALSIPFAVALAFVSGAGAAQERPNTTLVQKAKPAAAAANKSRSTVQSPAPLSGTSDRAKRSTPIPASTAPAAEAQHECGGMGAEA